MVLKLKRFEMLIGQDLEGGGPGLAEGIYAGCHLCEACLEALAHQISRLIAGS
jgi:hypothetical protein